MKEVLKAYKYRIYPNDIQIELINKTFGSCRWYWNQVLSDNKKAYEETEKAISKLQLSTKKIMFG